MTNRKRMNFRLTEDDDRRVLQNMGVRGFTCKADYIRYLIREDNPFVNSLREEFINLKLDLKSIIKTHNESQFDLKKMVFLNYKTLMLLLGYFADASPTQEAIEKVKKYIADREREFEDYWRKKNRKR